MTEEEAKGWLDERGWLSGIWGERLHRLADLVIAESARQNLIAASTIPHFWARHVVDSAQLLELAQSHAGLWVDLGSGGGFPGLVVAALREEPMLLVETRGLRARFLEACVEALGLAHASVAQSKVERLNLGAPASIISARAFASLDRTLALAMPLARRKTLWLLPKGQSAQLELESAREEWQAVFHVKQSLTDPDSAIITATHVCAKKAGTRSSPRSPKP